jgi:hypothetical protein
VVNNTVTGVAAAGVISGGTVKVFQPYSSLTGADKKQIGATTTTSTVAPIGSYSVSLGSYSGPVVVEITGGSYIDEAGNVLVSAGIPAGVPLRAAVSSVSGSVSVAVTPLTELAVKQAREQDKKLGAASIDAANAQVSDLFKVDIIKTTPLDASAPISAGTQAQQDYTIALATLSQLAGTPANLDATLANLAANISPAGSMAPATAAALNTALTAFVAPGNTNNKTGVTAVPTDLQNLGKTTLKLTLALTGTGVRGVDTTVTLPAGVTASADGTGATLASVFTLPAGSTITQPSGKFTPAVTGVPATLRLILNSPSAVVGAGDIATLNFNLDAGAAVPTAADFTLSGTALFDINGTQVAGATLSVH